MHPSRTERPGKAAGLSARFSALPLLLICTINVTAATAQNSSSGDFRASAVKVNITPGDTQWLLGYQARQSEGVHDSLYHRIVALDDGQTQFFLISTDVCLVSPAFYDAFTRELEGETGIPPSHVWWTATHTHSAPETGPPGLLAPMLSERFEHEPDVEYGAWVKDLLLEGVKEARAKLEPARLGIGTGRSMANINRRAIDPDGRASLGMNPDGPVDRQIGLIRLERPDGTPIALIANYAMHGTVLGGQNVQISGDAQGIVATYVEEQLGAPMLYINGAAGDIAPIYSVYPDFRSGHITQFNVLLGYKILAANEKIVHATPEVRLSLGEVIIETPRKEDFGWVEELDDYTREASNGTHLVRVPVDFLQINDDMLLWSAPLELFNEIATEVRARSPFPMTFYYGYSNGWMGYLPTKQAFAEGGYEAGRVTPFTEQGEEDFREGVMTYIHTLHGRTE